MNALVPLLLLGSALLVAARHRAWRGAAALVATTTVLCGAGTDAELPPDDEESLTLGVAGSGGRYQEACGPAHTYGTVAVNAQYRREIARDLDFTTDLQVAGSSDWYEEEDIPGTQRDIGYSVRPMIGLDHYVVGGSLGGHFGRIGVSGGFNPVMPAASLRIGPRDIFFLDAAFAEHFAGSWPGGWLRMGLGVGVPPMNHAPWNHSVLRLGVADSGVYLGAEVGLSDALLLDVFASYGDETANRLAFGLRWRPRLRRQASGSEAVAPEETAE